MSSHATVPVRVSVITPVLNRRDPMALCLMSVAAQTYPHVEHIVVDGGSTDGTVELLSSTDDPRLRWISEPDAGMYDAINKGLSMATGDILAYLNSDDFYLPYTVEVALAALRGSDLIYGDLGVLSTDNESFRPQCYRPFDQRHYTYFEAIGQPAVFWTRSLTHRIGLFYTSYGLIADCEYWLRAAAAGAQMDHVEEILAIQVDHPGTLRSSQRQQLDQEFERLRSAKRPIVGPPQNRLLKGISVRIRTRRDRFRFALAMRRRGGQGPWSRFAGFIRARGIAVDGLGLLWLMLPGRMRPRTASLIDAERLQDELALAFRAKPD